MVTLEGEVNARAHNGNQAVTREEMMGVREARL